MKKPKVSIIIPCYNNEDSIAEAIKSCLDQTYSDIEIIVIDDGSTDNSLEVIKSFKNKNLKIITQKNKSAPSARNRGLEKAKGEYVKFLDADDILFKNSIEKQVTQTQKISSKKNKFVVYGDVIKKNELNNRRYRENMKPRESGEDPIAHILENNPLTSSPLHRKKYLKEINGFDPSLKASQEYDLHVRLVLSGIEFIHFPLVVYEHRDNKEKDKISNKVYKLKKYRHHLEIIEKHKNLIEKKKGVLSPKIKSILAKKLWFHGRNFLKENNKKAAKIYFREAKKLSPDNHVNGGPIYKTLLFLAGRETAEKIIMFMHKILSIK